MYRVNWIRNYRRGNVSIHGIDRWHASLKYSYHAITVFQPLFKYDNITRRIYHVRTLQKPMNRTWTSHELITLRSAKHRTQYVQSIFVNIFQNKLTFLYFVYLILRIN